MAFSSGLGPLAVIWGTDLLGTFSHQVAVFACLMATVVLLLALEDMKGVADGFKPNAAHCFGSWPGWDPGTRAPAGKTAPHCVVEQFSLN